MAPVGETTDPARNHATIVLSKNFNNEEYTPLQVIKCLF